MPRSTFWHLKHVQLHDVWKANVWINISGGSILQVTMSKVLQDKNLNLKELTVTFTARTIQMNLVFFPSSDVLFCFVLFGFFVLFFTVFCLFNITSNIMFLSICAYISMKYFTGLIHHTAVHGISCSLGFKLQLCSLYLPDKGLIYSHNLTRQIQHMSKFQPMSKSLFSLLWLDWAKKSKG